MDRDGKYRTKRENSGQGEKILVRDGKYWTARGDIEHRGEISDRERVISDREGND